MFKASISLSYDTIFTETHLLNAVMVQKLFKTLIATGERWKNKHVCIKYIFHISIKIKKLKTEEFYA